MYIFGAPIESAGIILILRGFDKLRKLIKYFVITSWLHEPRLVTNSYVLIVHKTYQNYLNTVKQITNLNSDLDHEMAWNLTYDEAI